MNCAVNSWRAGNKTDQHYRIESGTAWMIAKIMTQIKAYGWRVGLLESGHAILGEEVGHAATHNSIFASPTNRLQVIVIQLPDSQSEAAGSICKPSTNKRKVFLRKLPACQ